MKHIYKKIMIVLMMMLTMACAHAADSFSHTVLLLLDNPRVDEAWSRTITSQEEWEEFYYIPLAYMTFSQDSNIPSASTFDFEKYQIITGGLGVKYSNDLFIEYTLSVEKVIEEESEIVIYVFDIGPAINCDSTREISGFPNYPTATVLVKKTDKPFRFDKSKLTKDCP